MSGRFSFAGWRQWAKAQLNRWLGRPVAEAQAMEAAPPPDLSGLEKQIARLGREQFKINTLLETQQQQVQAALQQLREQDERREKERAGLLAGRPAELAEARLQVVQRLLPVLDGLDEALAAGERLLERAPSLIQIQEIKKHESDPLPVWVNLAAGPLLAIGLIFPGLVRQRRRERQRALARVAADMAAWEDAQVAWLRGLELVRERLLETLALEGVEPIEAVGRPFDPHCHVALDTAPAGPGAPPGIIVSEVRRGYAVGPRVLRYAEVVVARAPHRGAEPDPKFAVAQNSSLSVDCPIHA